MPGRATQPFILPPVEEEEEEEGWGVVGVRAVGRCNWSPKIMGQFGWRVIQGGMLVLNIRHQWTIGNLPSQSLCDATSMIEYGS